VVVEVDGCRLSSWLRQAGDPTLRAGCYDALRDEVLLERVEIDVAAEPVGALTQDRVTVTAVSHEVVDGDPVARRPGAGAQPDNGRGGRPPTTMIARSLSVLPSPSGTVTVIACSPAERSAVSS
jgi:hypothetical protein